MGVDETWGALASLVEKAVEKDGTGVCICGMDGAIMYVNRAFLRMLRGDDMDGPPPEKVADMNDAFAGLLAAVKKDNNLVRENISVATKTSIARSISCSASVQDDDSFRGVVIIAHDVTGSIRVDTDDQWHAIVDSLEDGYYECDIDGKFIAVNSAMCRITEYGHDDLIGMSYSTCFTPEDAEEVSRQYNEVFKSRKPARIVNFTGITKSGRKRKIEGSIAIIKDADDRIKGFRGIIRDMTEKTKMEMEILRARKIEAIGILAGGIAHDYNNVLTAILGNISLAKMEVGSENTNLAEVLNDAEVASLKAVELTRRLSTFARGGKPERKVIDYTESLKTIVDSVLCNYTGRHELIIQDRLWDVEVDEFQIGQVVTYILNNAMEAMAEPGMIRITAENALVEKEASHHEISLQPGNYVRISISDEGVGIPVESLHNIFDPYYTTKEMASGLGLATSYAIIKRHHGYIDVQSAEGKGSTFYVYLPVAR